MQTQMQDGVVLHLGTQVELAFTLTTGVGRATGHRGRAAGVSSTVTQTAVATVVTQQQIDNLPINGRDFISFSVITPGVTHDNTPQQGASATSGLTFAGQRARSNNITVDGLDNNDITVGSVRADVQPGGGPRVPGRHQLVLGGVRQGLRRRGQHRDEERHQHACRQCVLLLPRRRRSTRRATSSASRRPATPIDRRQGAVRAEAVRRHVRRPDPEGQDVLLRVVRAAGRPRPTTSSPSTTRRRFVLFGQPIGTAVDILRAAGFPVETGQRPVRGRDRISSSLKVDRQISGNAAGLAPLQLRRRHEREHRAVGRPGGEEPRRRPRQHGQHARRVAHRRAVVDGRQRAALSVRAPRPEGQLARSELRRSVHRRGSGRTDAGDPRRRQRRPAALHAAAAPERPLPGARYAQPAPRAIISGRPASTSTTSNHKVQALPLHFGGRYLFQALPAIPGLLPAPITGIQALALGLPAAYIQGYGNRRRPTDTVTCRSSRRMTGASRPTSP